MSLHPAYEYPFRGVIYLLIRPALWRDLFCGIILSILVTIATSILLFFFAFPAQSIGLSSFIVDWLSWIIGFFLTLFEIGIVTLIISCLFLAYYMDKIFDRIWREETMSVEQRVTTPRQSLIKYSCIKSFLILIVLRVFLVVITSPLNLIPILGTILYVYLNGYYYAWSLHCRYFDILGLTFLQGKDFVEKNEADYRQFGIIAVLLEMIPLLNFVTPVTNMIGSALWACDIERYGNEASHPRTYLLSPSPNLLEQGQSNYGTKEDYTEKLPYAAASSQPPPDYQQVVEGNLYPSAPPLTEKQ